MTAKTLCVCIQTSFGSLDVIPSATLRDVLRTPDNLVPVFNRYFKDRKARGAPTLSGPYHANEMDRSLCSLFSLQDSKKSDFEGKDRNAGAQRPLVYFGSFEGYDALQSWSVDPVGAYFRLKGAAPRLPNHLGIDFTVDDDVTCTGVVVKYNVVNDMVRPAAKAKEAKAEEAASAEEAKANEAATCLAETHKLLAFLSYFGATDRWIPLPSLADLGYLKRASLSATEKHVLKLMNGASAHRGFLFYGPAGTGKSHTVRSVVSLYRMNCVWGYSENVPVVGTGAALKGGLQGDLEMRILALFMRADAAPWLPTAITVDEIDFTAPSRTQIGSNESGGNLWLERLSDGVRARNVTFFATTNVRSNVLEQLVDRLDNIFVGLLGNATAAQRLAAEAAGESGRDWSDALRREFNNLFYGVRRQVPLLQAKLLGATPRMLHNLRTLEGVDEQQLDSNPWPTLTNGKLSYGSLLSRNTLAATADDCGKLLRFLIIAHEKNLLSGRVLVDTTRLRERLVIVEVEMLAVGADTVIDYVDPVYNQGADMKKHVLRAGRIKSVNRDDLYRGERVHVPAQAPTHTTYAPRRRCYVRTYVLHEQEDELGIWAVLARFAFEVEAEHCSFMSDEFLRTCVGDSHSGADERNRTAIRTAIEMYQAKSNCAVLVMPMAHARVQKAAEGESAISSSSILAHEVWSMIQNGWRCRTGQHGVFALLATETWEIDALAASATVAWPTSEYREHLLEREEEQRECMQCGRTFGTKTQQDRMSCEHTGNVIRYAPVAAAGVQQPWITATVVGAQQFANWVAAGEQVRWSLVSIEEVVKAKWTCCGKGYWELECPQLEHRAASNIEERAPHRDQTHRHPDTNNNRWWCNTCCSSVAAPGCS
jgi:hypothetical protein